MKLHFFVDDSGKLYKNEKYFVYSFLVFSSEKSVIANEKKFKKHLLKLKEEWNLNLKTELKASKLDTIDKKFEMNKWLIKNKIWNFCALVKNEKLYNETLDNNEKIINYKEYILKMSIRNFLEKLRNSKKIDLEKVIEINVTIDKQEVNKLSTFNIMLEKEINFGFANSYGTPSNKRGPLTNQNSIKVNTLKMVDSNTELLIQAADFLANFKRSIYKYKNNQYREYLNGYNKCYKFPDNQKVFF